MASQDFSSDAETKESKVLPSASVHQSPKIHRYGTSGSKKLEFSIHEAQEAIYSYFLGKIQSDAPDLVLQEFKSLFIELIAPLQGELIQAIHVIVSAKNELEFKNLFKRCCYIILNNWISQRQYSISLQLIQAIDEAVLNAPAYAYSLNRLRIWLINFVKSKDYQEIKLFVSKYDPSQNHWSHRYTPFLLAPQYVDASNSKEQRQVARLFSQQLKEQFKFELAMFTSHSQSVILREECYPNPTTLGDEALRLIKIILVNRGSFSYPRLAHLFLQQSRDTTYKLCKQGLIQYLFYYAEETAFINVIKKKIKNRLELLYISDDRSNFHKSLLLRTCNYLIKFLTVETSGKPSSLFRVFVSQGNPLTLAILMLKLVLISPNSRTYLEVCLARLIYYYEDDSPDSCQWFIQFLEICQIALTIYGENVEYNLVNMSNDKKIVEQQKNYDLNSWRVFSQQKISATLEQETERTDSDWSPLS